MSDQQRQDRWVGRGMFVIAVAATANLAFIPITGWTWLSGVVPVGYFVLLFVPPPSAELTSKVKAWWRVNVRTLSANVLLLTLNIVLAWLVNR